MASHAYSWNIIGWRHLTHTQFVYLGQAAGHAILDEHDFPAAAFRPTARLYEDLDLSITMASTSSSSSNLVQTHLVQLFVNCYEDHNKLRTSNTSYWKGKFVINKYQRI